MANNYTRILIHLVFVVENRNCLITSSIREELQRYITGIVNNKGHKMQARYCMPDHCHILIGLNPKQSVSDLARDVKSASSSWINDKKMSYGKFAWQGGFSAFSYAKSQLDIVANYILKQPEHHQEKTFRQEYIEFLKNNQIDYDEKCVFDFFD